MSAEILRRAAALMRERAEAASGGAWRVDREETRVPGCVDYLVRSNTYGHIVTGFGEGSDADRSGDAEHIASWHPAVALAVADWLDHEVEHWDDPNHSVHLVDGEWECEDECTGCCRQEVAMAVARAYLGESA